MDSILWKAQVFTYANKWLSFPEKWLNSSNKSICQWLLHFRRQYPLFHLWLVQIWPTLRAYVYHSENPRAWRNCKKIDHLPSQSLAPGYRGLALKSIPAWESGPSGSISGSATILLCGLAQQNMHFLQSKTQEPEEPSSEGLREVGSQEPRVLAGLLT